MSNKIGKWRRDGGLEGWKTERVTNPPSLQSSRFFTKEIIKTIAQIRDMFTIRRIYGSGCRPVAALVFKISGRLRAASVGGFDSHPLPSFYLQLGLLENPVVARSETSHSFPC